MLRIAPGRDSSAEVSDPSTADRGRYSEFAGYFFATPSSAASSLLINEESAESNPPARISLLLSCGRPNPSVTIQNLAELAPYVPSSPKPYDFRPGNTVRLEPLHRLEQISD